MQLSNLPGAKQEALAIAKLFNTQAMIGQQATKTAIVQQMPNARIIHLATHGLLHDTKSLGVPGAITLAPSGNGQLNDGLVTADEILDMKLNAELVVLSACDTGRGRITGMKWLVCRDRSSRLEYAAASYLCGKYLMTLLGF